MIERLRGISPPGRNDSVAYKDLVWTVANAADESLDLTGQTAQALDILDKNLTELGSHKTHIASAQVYLANIDDKPVMDKVWRDWIGTDPQHWPQRACLGVSLGGHWLIEVTVTAIKINSNSDETI